MLLQIRPLPLDTPNEDAGFVAIEGVYTFRDDASEAHLGLIKHRPDGTFHVRVAFGDDHDAPTHDAALAIFQTHAKPRRSAS